MTYMHPMPTMIMGMHGVLALHPWIRSGREDGTMEEDVFSLAVNRTVAYGPASFNAERGPSPCTWPPTAGLI